MSADHDWDKKSVLACTSTDLSYYIKNGLFAHSQDHLGDLARSFGQSRSVPARIKIAPNVSLPDNPASYIVGAMMEEAVKSGQSAKISYSFNERNRCFFAKFV